MCVNALPTPQPDLGQEWIIREEFVTEGEEIARGSFGLAKHGTIFSTVPVVLKSLHALLNPELYELEKGSHAYRLVVAEVLAEAK